MPCSCHATGFAGPVSKASTDNWHLLFDYLNDGIYPRGYYGRIGLPAASICAKRAIRIHRSKLRDFSLIE
jgi:hypothetical protein